MSALFNSPKTPTIPQPPVQPSLEQQAIQQAADEEQRQRARYGRASNYLTNPAMEDDSTSAARFLGTIG